MQSIVTKQDVLSDLEYRRRVMGCWLGKAVGGTLGMPFEGQDGPHDLSFYTPVPTKMLPNDDLDLQVVWACVLDKLDPVRVDRHVLAQAWLDHVEFPWDEYGVAIRNLKNGLKAPLSGSYDNWFTDSMGAPIRSEIWACLAPGNLDLAAAYAYEDGCVDHGGEGLWAEVFLAALESAAFTQGDPDTLLDAALKLLPETSRTRCAVADAARWWKQSRNWREVRSQILENHGCDNFTDAPMNIAFTVLGWLAGEGDFSQTICIAVNCGKDTDCTGATVGALMGILDPDGIPARWLEPIGRDLVLSPEIIGLNPPDTLDGFTDLLLDLRDRLNGQAPDACSCRQSTEPSRLAADVRFVPDMPSCESAPDMTASRIAVLPGTVGAMLSDDFEQDILLIRYRFHLARQIAVRVMFNTREESRAWLDGKFAFTRAGGAMGPSFHRSVKDQYVDATLIAGDHELIAAVRRPSARPKAEWVVGVGEIANMQWIPDAFAASP